MIREYFAEEDDFEKEASGSPKKVLRERPPRYLDVYSKGVILFSGLLQQMGWAFFGFGSIFFWVFVMNSEARYLFSFDGEWTHTEGIIKEVKETNSEINDQRLYAYHFEFQVNNKLHEGVSYDFYRPDLQEKRVYPVEYKAKNLKRAQLKGMSSSTFPVWVAFVVIFPLIGLLMIIFSMIANIKAIRLLINGIFSRGKLLRVETTGSSINDVPVMKYTFQFEVDNKQHEAVCRTHLAHTVVDEETEVILYNPYNPKENIVFDAVPGTPEIDHRGHFKSASIMGFSVFILPLLAIFINFMAYYLFSIFS